MVNAFGCDLLKNSSQITYNNKIRSPTSEVSKLMYIYLFLVKMFQVHIYHFIDFSLLTDFSQRHSNYQSR